MDIKYKLKLIEMLRLRPADLEAVNNVRLSDKCLESLLKDDRSLFEKELDQLISDNNNSDQQRMIAASLKSLSLLNSASDLLDNFKDDYDSNTDWDFDVLPDEAKVEEKEEKKQEDDIKPIMSFKEAKKMISELSQEELTKKYCEYIMENHPELENGFDNGLYRIAMNEYHMYIGIHGKEYLLGNKESLKVYMARRGVMPELNIMIDNLFFSQLEKWKTEYKNWLEQRHENRITKKSIKMFFEEHGKNVSDKVLDKMKLELSKM